jgi:serine/threonine protein kinase
MLPSTLSCNNCGALNQPQAAFCRSCGSSLQAAKPTLYNSATGRLLANVTLKQRYRIITPVGKGGMGAVYKAEDIQLGNRKVAVKEMSQSGLTPQEISAAAEAFKQEAHLLAGLQHPNLPNIYDHFSENGRWYLVMSFIQGETLEEYLISKGGKLPLEEVLQPGIQLCTVLDYLHNQQPPIIFRDLKPANIMRTSDGHLYLIDFGIARHFKPGQAKDTAYYGSMGYAPPEQYGRAQTTPRSDIYSLGATLYQLVSGHHPSTTPFRFPPLQSLVPTAPTELSALIMQMLELDEDKRPSSMQAVKQELQVLVAGTQQKNPSTPTPDVASFAPTQLAKTAPGSSANAPTQLASAFAPKQLASSVASPLSVQTTIASSSPIPHSFWDSIDEFLHKKRIVLWLCFLILVLVIGLRTDYFIYHTPDMVGFQGDYGIVALSVAIAGATLVGLIFLLIKSRPLIDIIGGIALAVFGSIVLLTYLSGIVASCTQGPDPYGNFSYYSQDCFPFQVSGLSYPIPILFLSILMLSVGTYLFLRRVNAIGGFIFGILLILQIFLQRGLLYSYSEVGILNPSPWPPILPGVLSLIWFPPVLLGSVAIIVALFKIKRKSSLIP